MPLRSRAAARAAAGLAFFAAGGCASLTSAAPLQFVDRTYFAPKTYRDTTILYDAFIAPPIFIYDDQLQTIDGLTAFNGPASAIGSRVFVTPAFIVRQLGDSSAAVRTPSFNPRASAELYRVSALQRVLKAGRPEFDWARIDALRLTVAHHSDGQAGCFLQEQKPAKPGSFEADDCSAPLDTGFVHTNRANGDFSTTYVSFLWHETLFRRGAGQRTPFSAGIAFSYDWELPKASRFPGVLPDIERQFYGSWRSRVQTDVMVADRLSCSDNRWLCILRGPTRFVAMYEWAPRHLGALASRLDQPIPHFRSYFDASHTFDALHNFGLLVRRVDGQDYYNIGFVRRRQATLVGIVLDLGGNEFAR